MKVFFDECMPRPLIALLAGLEIETAQGMGWGRKKNGELLKLTETQFEVFVTTDRNLRYQQNLKGRKIAILVLTPNVLSVLLSNYVRIGAAIKAMQPGEYQELTLA
ncbi:MAG: hypothetical protein PHV34_08195 [Verrucomicrobiae bacterium]|nr:hypothetical protein [Verrucomicrobiae bacterium]